MIKGIKKFRILISFIVVLVIALGGTFAWLRYQSVRSRMVLTIGNINSVMVTMAPYEFNGGLSPVSTYTSATSTYTHNHIVDGATVTITEKSGNVVDITAVNNTSSPAAISFYYHINSIDSALAIADLKYTVVDGSSSVASGSFTGKTAGNEEIIYSFSLPANTTKTYKIYLWLKSNGNQTALIGKSIDITFGTIIPKLMCGDINMDGVVNATDATLISQYVSGNETFTEIQKMVADVDGNTEITEQDATYLNQYTLGGGELRCESSSNLIDDYDDNDNSLYSIMLKNEYGLGSAEKAKMMISQKPTPNFATVATTNEGLFETVDDDGTVYYYRGAVNNNHVIFGNFCWKIVRTTGTGGVKLIYDGVPNNGTCNNTGTATHISKSAFNSSYNSLAYVGYMYGDARITNSVDITIKTTNVIFSNNATYNQATHMYVLDMTNSYEMIPSNWNSSNTSVNYTQVTNKHYTCLDNRTSCSEIYYVSAINSSDKNVYYQTLLNGEMIDDLIDVMFDNINSSNAKNEIDAWYQQNLIGYSSYLEDTIFCNDRSITSYGGWNKDNTNYNGWITFNAKNRNEKLYNPSLACINLNDKFTVDYGRGNGNLTYPVGLLTVDEMAMAGGKTDLNNSNYYLYNGQYQWSLSPYNFSSLYSDEWSLRSDGNFYHGKVDNSYGIRPVVSLKQGTLVASGDGSSTSPYIIE